MMEDKILNGKLESINTEKRQFTIKDVDGVIHPLNWVPVLDVVMQKWKPGYYLAVTMTQDDAVKNVVYWQEGKDKFPKPVRSGGGQPRNERIIVLQTCYKECAEMARQVIMLSSGMPEDKSDTQVMKELMDWVVERAKADADELCRHGGVK